MNFLKIENIFSKNTYTINLSLKILTKYALLCMIVFYTNHLYSQCVCNFTYNNSVQGNIPALTQASHFTNAENVTIAQGENIAFESGGFSLLCPGFVAEYGSVFSSKIESCNAGEDCFHTCISNVNQIESINRGPFLQSLLTDPESNEAEVIIKWRDKDNRAYTVEIISETGASYFYDEPYGVTIDGSYRILFLDGLDPNTRYRYNINYGGSNKEPIVGYFTTAPIVGSDIPDNDPVSFWVMGDAGDDHLNKIEEMRDAYFNYTEDDSANFNFSKDCNNDFLNTDFIINLGDNAYSDGKDDELQLAVFEPYRKILKYLPLWGALGNHESDYPFIVDNDTITGDDIHKYVFELPKVDTIELQGDTIDVNEQYYSFDYGNIHFVCLYSQFQSASDSLYLDENGEERRGKRYDDYNKMYKDMFNWLEADLTQAQSYSKWTILFFHKPVLTAGGRLDRSTMEIDRLETDSKAMRPLISDITNEYDIDLVLYGHNHLYERSYLVRCGDGVWDENGNIDTASTNLSGIVVNDSLGDFQILDYGCAGNSNCDEYQYIDNYDHQFEKEAGADNGTVFVTCGASSKSDGTSCSRVKHDFFNHPAMRIFSKEEELIGCVGPNGTITNGGRAIIDIGSLNFKVTNNKLTGTYISKNDTVLDKFTIDKNFSNNKLKQPEKIEDSKPELSVKPNPFESSFTINYEVSKDEVVNIDLFSIDGRKIKSIVEGTNHTAGQYNRTIDTSELQPGIYLVRVNSPSNQMTKKVMKVVGSW